MQAHAAARPRSIVLPNICIVHILWPVVEGPGGITEVGQTDSAIHALPLSAGADEPSVGTIKRALHDLSPASAGVATRDYAEVLREVHALVCRLARINGVDPDAALQRRCEAAQLQRDRMVLVSAGPPDPST